MPFLGQHLRVTWRFRAANTVEIAETNLCFSTVAPWTGAAAALDQLDPDDLIDLVPEMSDLLTTQGLNWADYSILAGIKVSAIDTTGSYVAGADPVEYNASTLVGGSTANTLPQDTVVISLGTTTTIGKGVRGRMYLPHTRMTLPNGFPYTSTTTRDGIVAAAALFVEHSTYILNEALTTTVGAVICGQTGIGTQKAVTGVRVGSVTDTQRRRRNAIPEIYSSAVVNPDGSAP